MTEVSRSRVVVAALGLSAAGHVVHNLAEFPPAILLGPETLVPLLVTGLLGIAWGRSPRRATFAATAAWAAVVIVGGGVSVLPLGVVPFTPEQSLAHYGAHLVYALLQLPLLWLGLRGLRSVPTRPPGAVAG